MLNPGLSTADFRSYLGALARSYRMRVRFDVLDLNNFHVATLAPEFLEGSEVAVDFIEAPSRTLTAVFIDRTAGAPWEPRSAGAAPLHRQYMARISVSVYVNSLARWVTVPVFTGPLWDFQRVGAVCTITAHGKERQAMGAAWAAARTFPRGMRKTSVLRAMAQLTGERMIAIPDLAMTTPQQITVARTDSWWPKMRQIAASMNMRMWYDGEGWLRLTPYARSASMVLGDQWLTEEITVGRTVEDITNTFEVIGAKPKGSKVPIRAVGYLPRPHPMSPWSLQRGGRPHYLVETYENEDIKTMAEAAALVKRFADDRAGALIEQQVSCLPIWCLEEGDAVGVTSNMGTFLLRTNSFTLPLDGSAMTLGRTTGLSAIEARARRAKGKAERDRSKGNKGKGRGRGRGKRHSSVVETAPIRPSSGSSGGISRWVVM